MKEKAITTFHNFFRLSALTFLFQSFMTFIENGRGALCVQSTMHCKYLISVDRLYVRMKMIEKHNDCDGEWQTPTYDPNQIYL